MAGSRQADPGAPAVYLSNQAYRRLLLEVLGHLGTETGGVLLGQVVEGAAYVVEILDPGPAAIFEPAYFEYDHGYLTHLANKVAADYEAELKLVGLWHRHPGSFDTFSKLDDQTNRLYANLCGGRAVSGLVNLDPHLRLTFYEVAAKRRRGAGGVSYIPMVVHLGDGRFPENLLKRKAVRALEQELRSRSQGTIAAAPPGGLLARMRRRPPAPAAQDLLRILDQELPFLEAQPDYSYQLDLGAEALQVTLVRTTHLPGLPERLLLRFGQDEGGAFVELAGRRQPYRPGIIQSLLDEAIAHGPEFGS